MSLKKVGLAAAGAAAAGAVVLGGASLADAAARTPVAHGGYGHPGGGYGHPGGGPGHTPVTGDELAKVTEAVKGENAAVTVDRVHKTPDGSYRVLGTKAGDRVFYEVSADLKTVTERTGGPRGGGRGPRAGTEVTGDELTKVTEAVKAEDAAVTVEGVRKAPDGSYRVLGRKAGGRVLFEVSADLATVTEHEGGPRGGRHHGPPR